MKIYTKLIILAGSLLTAGLAYAQTYPDQILMEIKEGGTYDNLNLVYTGGALTVGIRMEPRGVNGYEIELRNPNISISGNPNSIGIAFIGGAGYISLTIDGGYIDAPIAMSGGLQPDNNPYEIILYLKNGAVINGLMPVSHYDYYTQYHGDDSLITLGNVGVINNYYMSGNFYVSTGSDVGPNYYGTSTSITSDLNDGVTFKVGADSVLDAEWGSFNIAADLVLCVDRDGNHASILNGEYLIFDDASTIYIELDDEFVGMIGDQLYFGEIGDGSIVFTFEDGTVVDESFYSYNPDTGHFTFVKDVAIPEPSTYAAIFGGLVLAFAAYRRRK